MDIKRVLAALIASADLSQEAVEALTGIDQARISRILKDGSKNRPTLHDVLKIEAACGVEPGYVLAAAGLISIEGVEAGARARVVGARKGIGR